MIFGTVDLFQDRNIGNRTTQIGVTNCFTGGYCQAIKISIVIAMVRPVLGRLIVPILWEHIGQIYMEKYGKDVRRRTGLYPYLLVHEAAVVAFISHPVYRPIERRK